METFSKIIFFFNINMILIIILFCISIAALILAILAFHRQTKGEKYISTSAPVAAANLKCPTPAGRHAIYGIPSWWGAYYSGGGGGPTAETRVGLTTTDQDTLNDCGALAASQYGINSPEDCKACAKAWTILGRKKPWETYYGNIDCAVTPASAAYYNDCRANQEYTQGYANNCTTCAKMSPVPFPSTPAPTKCEGGTCHHGSVSEDCTTGCCTNIAGCLPIGKKECSGPWFPGSSWCGDA
jgi:hypothetical protein